MSLQVCNAESYGKIKLKLKEIQKAYNFHDIVCKFSERKIKLQSISLEQAQNRLEIWEKSAFECPLYNTAMKNLGYQLVEGSWFIFNKPSEDIVIDCFYKYLFYYYIVDAKRTSQIDDLECSSERKPSEYIIKDSLTPPHSEIRGLYEEVQTEEGNMVTGNKIRGKLSINENFGEGVGKYGLSGSINQNDIVKSVMCIDSYNEKCLSNNFEVIQIDREYCQKCGNNEIILNGLCHHCLSLSTSWNCKYRLCGKNNCGDSGDAYCKHCGLAKGYDGVGGDVIMRYRNGRMDDIWICDKCDKINEDCSSLLCTQCRVSRYFMRHFGPENEIVNSVDNYVAPMSDRRTNGDLISDDKEEILPCQCMNRSEVSVCTACSTLRLQAWTCEKCTLENEFLNKQCTLCGHEKGFCKKCGLHKIIREELCGDCLNSCQSWWCWHLYCQKINYVGEKYCSHCGLERHRSRFSGAPVWKLENGRIEQKWVCHICQNINSKFSSYCCNHKCSARRYMLYKWCMNCGHGNPSDWSKYQCGVCRLWF